jgi:hypothetical protein
MHQVYASARDKAPYEIRSSTHAYQWEFDPPIVALAAVSDRGINHLLNAVQQSAGEDPESYTAIVCLILRKPPGTSG